MSEKAEHTPLPWKVRDHQTQYGGRHIWIEGGPEIGRTMAGPYKREILEDEDYPEKLADAELIANSVNSVPDLVKALEEIVETFKPFTMRPVGAPGSSAREDQEHQIAVHSRARAALSKYRGEAA